MRISLTKLNTLEAQLDARQPAPWGRLDQIKTKYRQNIKIEIIFARRNAKAVSVACEETWKQAYERSLTLKRVFKRHVCADS